jgi:hypothetical protein|tara:strand:- start:195 stop:521 length:327 start_codon:yes stop_codon:yes gene_type:complete
VEEDGAETTEDEEDGKSIKRTRTGEEETGLDLVRDLAIEEIDEGETNRTLEETMDEEPDEEETIATIDMKRRTIEGEEIIATIAMAEETNSEGVVAECKCHHHLLLLK